MAVSARLGSALFPSSRVLITGATGRVGSELVRSMTRTSRVNPQTVYLDLARHSQREMKEILRRNHVRAVVNTAAVFTGNHDTIRSVNEYGTQKLAAATNELDIPLVQFSSTLSKRRGISRERHPYAYSKKEAVEAVKHYPKVAIIHADTLLGSTEDLSRQTDIAMMAGIPRVLPFTVHLDTPEQTIQPTTYGAVAKATSTLTERMIAGREVPKEVVMGGAPVKISDLIRKIHPEALIELHFKPEDFLSIAEKAQNGVMTPEFVHITTLAETTGTETYSTEDFADLLGEPVPTTDEVAAIARDGLTIKHVGTVGLNVFMNSSWGLSVAGLGLLTKAQVMRPSSAAEQLS